MRARQHTSRDNGAMRAAGGAEYASDRAPGLMPPSLQLYPIQREGESKKASEGEAKKKSAEEEDKPFDLGEWISDKAYDALKKELGESKLKGHAGKVAEAAAGQLKKLMKSAESGSELEAAVEETHLKNLEGIIKQHLAKEVLEIINSPQGKKVQKKLLEIVKTKPEAVIGMALAGLAIAYVTDYKLAKEKEFKLGDKFKGSVMGDFGSAKKIAFKTLKASLAYSGKSFQAALSGGYAKEGKKPGTNVLLDMAVGKKDKTQFATKSEIHIDPDKNLTFTLSPELRASLFGAGGTLTYSDLANKSWSGSAFMRIGSKKTFFKPIFTLDAEGNVVFKVDSQLLTDAFKLTGNFGYEEGKDKYSGAFGFGPKKGPGFSVSAGGSYAGESDTVPYPVWDANVAAGYKSPQFGIGGKVLGGSRANKDTGEKEAYGTAEATVSVKIAGDDRHSFNLQSTYQQNLLGPGSNLTGGAQYKGTIGSTPIYLNFNMGGYLVMPEGAGGAKEGEGPKPFNGSFSLVVPFI